MHLLFLETIKSQQHYPNQITNPSIATADLIVTKGKLNISVDEIIGKAGNKVYFTASVKNVLGEGVKGIAVEFYRNEISMLEKL